MAAENYILDQALIQVGLLDDYVEDVQQESTSLRFGMRWDASANKFTWSEAARNEDKILRYEMHEFTNTIMARVCLTAINTINTDLVFTSEIPKKITNNKLPTLDFLLWLERNGHLKHSYFQKLMKTPLVIMEQSAMSDNQRYSIFAN